MINKHNQATLLSISLSIIFSGYSFAQSSEQASTAEKEIDRIIVTAASRNQSVLKSSVSVSDVAVDSSAVKVARTTAEILRSIPGIRSEASGGEGNANIAVRGLPIASGGAKFLQIWEDGLPVLEFGDIAFGNADIFLRADRNIAYIEAIRGGSASTLASNSPGGVINFISKTGQEAGGSVSLTSGLSYNSHRLDAEYGGELSDDTYFHIGGFFRKGEGTRDIGYDGESGGQIKLNLTKEFHNGYIRFHGKYLNDHAISLLPMPMIASGTNGSPAYESVPNFDISEHTPHGNNVRHYSVLNRNNRAVNEDVKDGMHPIVRQFGLELSYDFANDWQVLNKFKFAKVSGTFRSLMTAEVGLAENLLNSTGAYLFSGDFNAALPAGSNLNARYATGPNAGQLLPNNANSNGLLMRTHTFNTDINSLDNLMNDIKISKVFDVGGTDVHFSLGYYHSEQDEETTWSWSSLLQDVVGNGNTAFVDVYDGDLKLTENGTYAYGVPWWGNCCTRIYDISTTIDAFYLTLGASLGDLELDASIRYDDGNTSGLEIGNRVQNGFDANGDGFIQIIEQNVATFDFQNAGVVDFDYDYYSYSVGANYSLSDNLAIFARKSRGARANSGRLLFGKIAPNGSAREQDIVNPVNQTELGLKYGTRQYSLALTAFDASTEELISNDWQDLTAFLRDYEAQGLELEATYEIDNFSFKAGATYTDAEIASNQRDSSLEGNTPRRQADWSYAFSAVYSADQFALGTNIVGTTESFAQDNNQLIMPSYTTVGLYGEYFINEKLTLSINVNNLFDKVGITESEEGAIAENTVNYVRQRAVNGRTVSGSIRYLF